MISAKIVADSINPNNTRLTTFVLTYPRFIHSEFMTHRMFSRNASSSRAIPVPKQIQMVIDNPAIPLAFTKNKPGMQGGAILDGEAHELAIQTWLEARDAAVVHAKTMVDLEIHKQYANRILEPFAHITVVCTATEFDNFFALRLHPMAQPEICELAKQMYAAYTASQPQRLSKGYWHTPFIDGEDCRNAETYVQLNGKDFDLYTYVMLLVKMSVARCARVSYLNHEGKRPSIDEDLKLYDRLLGHLPIHASPAEHQGECREDNQMSGNFRGWTQYRKTLLHENVEKFLGPDEN